MLRCGQMMLAETLLRRHALPRDRIDEAARRRIIQHFADDPMAPFSIHQIAITGGTAVPCLLVVVYRCCLYSRVWHAGRPVVWAQQVRTVHQVRLMALIMSQLRNYCIRRLILRRNTMFDLSVYVTENAIFSRQELGLHNVTTPMRHTYDPCIVAKTQWRHEWTDVLALVPVQLGVDRINEAFIPALQQVFAIPQSVGVLGGGFSAAHYYFGVNGIVSLCSHHKVMPLSSGDIVLSLDPHTTQDFADMTRDSSASLKARLMLGHKI